MESLDKSNDNSRFEEDIKGAVVHNYLREKGNDKSNLIYSSSDTVNELLQGLVSDDTDSSIKKLTKETSEFLPTFSKVLNSSETGDITVLSVN